MTTEHKLEVGMRVRDEYGREGVVRHIEDDSGQVCVCLDSDSGLIIKRPNQITPIPDKPKSPPLPERMWLVYDDVYLQWHVFAGKPKVVSQNPIIELPIHDALIALEGKRLQEEGMLMHDECEWQEAIDNYNYHKHPDHRTAVLSLCPDLKELIGG